MNVFELVGKYIIDGAEKAEKQLKGLEGYVKNNEKAFKAAGKAMTIVGAIITGVATKAVIDYAKMGDEVHKMSLRTGFATESLSQLKYAAAIGGASLDDVEKSAKRMASTLLDAKDGLSTSVDALNRLGLTVEDFERLSPEDAFMRFSGAIAGIEDPLERSALAQDIFGKSGTALLPMLSEGTEGLREMMAEAENFAPIFGKEAAEAAAKLTDTMGQLKGAIDKVKVVIAEQLVPTLIPLLEKVRDAIAGISTWAKEHPELTRVVVATTVAAGGLMLVMGPLLIALPGIATGIKGVTVAVAALNIPLGVLVGLLSLATVGLALVGGGVYLLYQNQELANRAIREAAELQTEYNKALQGEANILPNLLYKMWQSVDARYKSGEATEEEIGWLIKYSPLIREYINSTNEAKDAVEGRTDAIKEEIAVIPELSDALKELMRVEEDRNKVIWGQAMAENARANAILAARRAEEGKELKFGGATTQAGLDYLVSKGYFTSASWERTVAPFLADGGIAMKPMLANIAEKQPEAVIPLDRMGKLSSPSIVINVNEMNVRDNRDIDRIAEQLVARMRLRGVTV